MISVSGIEPKSRAVLGQPTEFRKGSPAESLRHS